MAARTLTTKAVARALNVSVATIKRWADEGRLAAERTAGGHRRFRVEEIARFQRGQQRGGADERAPRQRVVSRAAERALSNASAQLFEQLLAGEAEEAAALLLGAHLSGASAALIFDRLLCVAMRRIGELWYQGELSIAQEHLATRTALGAVYALRRAVAPSPAGLSALCSTVADDYHELPAHLAQIVLESDGWRVINFGASTPFFALAEAVEQHRPQLVCVSATVLYDVDYATYDYKEFRRVTTRRQAAVVLGGQGFSDETIRRRFPAELYAESFTKLADFIRPMRHAR